jgi:hypothetical protein
VADAAAGATFVDSQGNTQAVVGADGAVDNTVSWSGVLPAGVYTLAIGGANLFNYGELFTHVRNSLGGTDTTTMCGDTTCANLYAANRLARSLSITGFNVTPVPAPAAVWLFGTAAAAAGAMARRRRRKPA